MLVMSCDVDFGASGAPVFVLEHGEPRLVSVISAMAEVEGRKVSLGTPLADPLRVLRAKLDAARHGDHAGTLAPETWRDAGMPIARR